MNIINVLLYRALTHRMSFEATYEFLMKQKYEFPHQNSCIGLVSL